MVELVCDESFFCHGFARVGKSFNVQDDFW